MRINNIALFSLIVQELHRLSRCHDISYELFVHDQTSEFSKALKASFEIISQFEFKEPNELLKAEKANGSFKQPKIKFSNRQNCLQLRIVDLILWTITRVSKKGYFRDYDHINRLFDLLMEVGVFSFLTPEQLSYENQYYKEKLFGKSFHQEELDNAREFLSSIEMNRKRTLL